eukprot:TRINITY_DN15746_c0_g2_i10.p2 TRINITY_DN15746_c0_g2~~TRINITY_DN15746_c0_g2_i10.p2  ORF type:complete len:283 (+),score=76.49 TRINITY_DN15746_c0_g2_i10:77-925(+)
MCIRDRINIVFGESDPKFKSFGDSLISCLLMQIGVFDIKDLQKDYTFASMFIIFFDLILFTYVIQNILLAILEINFTIAKREYSNQDEKVRKLNVLLCCCLKRPEDENQEERMMKADLQTGLNVLEKMKLELGLSNKSINWWADILSDQIRKESKLRKEFRRNVLNKTNKVPNSQIGDETDECARDAAIERKSYQHYLRLASQYLDYQRASIEAKRNEMTKMIRNEHNENIEAVKEYHHADQVISKITQLLNARTEQIRFIDPESTENREMCSNTNLHNFVD